MIKLPSKLPYLTAALGLVGPRGMCFHRAAGLVLDLPPATLAVGTLPAATSAQLHQNPELSSVDYLHAWVEMKEFVLAPTLFERSKREGTPWIVQKADYYRVNKPRDIRYMSRATLKKLADKYGMYAHLKHFTSLKHDAKFGDIILTALGIPYVVTVKGGVIPAPKEAE